jgi:uncharacterized protein
MKKIVDMVEIKEILKKSHTIAVVGLSPKESRPSNLVARYLMDVGFKVVPVNPGHNEILGKKCYPDLLAIDEPVDIVDIFRKSEKVLRVVEDAVTIGAKVVWMQQGVINHEAAKRARDAGLAVIMDRCLKIDHNNLL